MNRAFKIAALILGAVLVLAAVLVLVLRLALDPNRYKDDIVQLVQTHTGRELRIDGPISLSVFPWLGLELTRVSLGNAPGFDATPFAQADSAGVRVALLPLLRREVIVDTVALHGLNLNLARNRKGEANWDDLFTAHDGTATGGGLAAFALGGVDVRDARISWRDEASGAAYSVQHLALRTGRFVPGEPVDLNLSFDLGVGAAATARVILTSRFQLDLERQRLEIPQLALGVGELTLTANIRGERLRESPAWQGTLEVAPFDVLKFLRQHGIDYRPTDKNALARLGLKTQLTASGAELRLSGLELRLDDSRLTGTLGLRDFAKPRYTFDLALDAIDLDRYLPDATPASSAKAAGAAAPFALLRGQEADGRLRIERLKAAGVRASAASLPVAAHGNLLTLGPVRAALYNGSVDARATLDARNPAPVLTLDATLTGVQVGPLLKDAGVYDKYTGTGNVVLKLASQGTALREIKQGLNGNANVVLRDGKIEGVNLHKLIQNARAAYNVARGKPVAATPAATDETVFRELRANWRIANGVARNDDLLLQGPALRASGQGTAHLVSETLDYRLRVTLVEQPDGKETTVPVIVSGSFAKPGYSVDFGEVLKEKAEKAIEKKLEKFLEKGLKR